MYGGHIREVALTLTGWQRGSASLDSHINRSEVLVGHSPFAQPLVGRSPFAQPIVAVVAMELAVAR